LTLSANHDIYLLLKSSKYGRRKYLNRGNEIMATKKILKPAAKKAAPKKTAVKKPVIKKAVVKKTAAKKAAPKKVTTRKAVVKKTAVKKAPAKKAAPKKAAVKKPAVKKAAGKKATPAAKTPVPSPRTRPLDRHAIHLRISEAAYYRFVNRGYRHGQHINDWYEAMKEILSEVQ
jgi:Histone H1-like nucleoprotein HC2/Protein of unknown function (DUF2934)